MEKERRGEEKREIVNPRQIDIQFQPPPGQSPFF